MYPNLYYFLKSVFGIECPALKIVNSFGLFVALCFLASAWLLTMELKRMTQKGLLGYTEEKIKVGAPASLTEILSNFIFGFLVGYKLIAIFLDSSLLSDPQGFMLSIQGNRITGLLFGFLFGGLKWYEKFNQKLKEPEERVIRIWSYDRVGDMLALAAIFGFAGAKIFHNLENWDDFVKDPIGALTSFSGLTFYGGLICAAIAIAIFAIKKKIKVIHLMDAFAPALMIGYAIGRIGCQVAGDGDWGILNNAYQSNAAGKLIPLASEQFQAAMQQSHFYYIREFGSLASVRHLYMPAFWHLPTCLFASNYPHNVISEGVLIPNCEGNFCTQLPIAVFPTPFYETVLCTLLFSFLWSIRKKTKYAGTLAGIYLILNGLERFLIEKIRVNTKYSALPFQPTQAKIISVLLILFGIGLVYYSYTKKLSLNREVALK